jgi:hypothetical protein
MTEIDLDKLEDALNPDKMHWMEAAEHDFEKDYNLIKDAARAYLAQSRVTDVHKDYTRSADLYKKPENLYTSDAEKQAALDSDIALVENALNEMAMQHNQIKGNNAAIAFRNIRAALMQPSAREEPKRSLRETFDNLRAIVGDDYDYPDYSANVAPESE